MKGMNFAKIFVTFCLLFYSETLLSQSRTVIAVLDFTTSEGVSSSAAAALSNVVYDELINSGNYIMVDRKNVQSILKEMGMQLAGVTSQEGLVQVGKMLNVQKMVSGNIGKLGNKFVLKLQLIDVETGSIEKSVVQNYFGDLEGLDNPVTLLTKKLIGIADLKQKGTHLYVTSKPPGVKIYLNDEFRGNSPLNILVQHGGDYLVKATASGYQNWVQQVFVEEGQTVFVNAMLTEEKGYRFVLKRDGPLVLGVGTALAAVYFRVKANGYYNDQKNPRSLAAYWKAKDNTEQNDKISYILGGISAVALGYSAYHFLKGDEVPISNQKMSYNMDIQCVDGIKVRLSKHF